MDNTSPLYLAHQNERQAEIHTQCKRFDEARACHQQAYELLQQALSLTKVTKALESLKLQQDYHKKQEDIIRVKKYQFDKKKKVLERRRQRKMATEKKTSTNEKDQDLQWQIFRAMEEADSLLEQLTVGNDEGKTVTETPPSSPPLQGVKRPKDDRTVIEELHTLNTQLRTLITQLLTQLDASERQVEMLRARLRTYEGSPPEDDSSLPYLAPLEMPQFDFSSIFSSQPSSILPPANTTTTTNTGN